MTFKASLSTLIESLAHMPKLADPDSDKAWEEQQMRQNTQLEAYLPYRARIEDPVDVAAAHLWCRRNINGHAIVDNFTFCFFSVDDLESFAMNWRCRKLLYGKISDTEWDVATATRWSRNIKFYTDQDALFDYDQPGVIKVQLSRGYSITKILFNDYGLELGRDYGYRPVGQFFFTNDEHALLARLIDQ
jgi:hypothetical protein